MEEGKYVVILGAGDFPTSLEALAVLKNASYLCCCDDAGKEYIDWLNSEVPNFQSSEFPKFRFPDAIVGDGDSLPQEFKKKYADIYHQVDEQDFNDLTKATRFVIKHFNPSSFTLHPSSLPIFYLGITGKREDHTIANIGFCAFFKHSLGVEPTIVTDYGTFTIHIGDTKLKTFPRQQVSIFNLSCSKLTSKNLKWDAYAYKELWQGALNEALTDEISFSADGEYIVFRTHLPKL